MATQYTTGATHAVAFPSKIDLGHILNLTITNALDNGTIRGVGDWIDFDRYADADCPADSFEGKIVQQAANGNWYVQVTKVDVQNPAVLIYEVPIIRDNFNTEFSSEKRFYNAAGATVRAYVLTSVYDIFEVSKEGFVGEPAVGATVTAAATTGKLTIG